jgi:hypothetical protein
MLLIPILPTGPGFEIQAGIAESSPTNVRHGWMGVGIVNFILVVL